MVIIKVHSFKRDKSVDVEMENVPDESYELIRKSLFRLLKEKRAFEAIAEAYVYAVELCPDANPSDVWQHIIYRTYMDAGNNEQSWKRASGQGFEEAFARIYNPRLAQYGIRLVVLSKSSAVKALKEMKLTGKIEPSKMDIAIEGNCNPLAEEWRIFGVVHGKTSLAERIKDDAPASRVIMKKGFLSVAATLDSKSFPPPHGDGVNHGELGGRTIAMGLKKNQPKRNYFEKDGDFTNGYSYNLRTPESPEKTKSGSRIKTLSFAEKQPDIFVNDVVSYWKSKRMDICKKMPVTKVK
ncbi:MAG: BsaWI family type II restriction enzyme [Bacteroidales bacterium]|nr:BsaWI family type II restriction enzyme [Bacteroidales bacterium]